VRIFLSQPAHRFSLLFFFFPAHRSHCTGTIFPEIREAVMAGMAIGPSDVNTGPDDTCTFTPLGFLLSSRVSA